MTNQFVDAVYDELTHRLALGIEPIDSAREQPMLMPVMLTFDDLPLGNARPQIQRHPSNRQVLLYDDYYAAEARNVDLRFFDQHERMYATDADRRRFVPRRLRIALPKLDAAQALPPAARLCRPHLAPGPAYPVGNVATGLRGRAMRAATAARPLRPARWVRVLATVPAAQEALAGSTVVGRACGDDRGEFLLLLRFNVAAIGIDPLLSVRLRVFAAEEVELTSVELPLIDRYRKYWAARFGTRQLTSVELQLIDPLWDLPLEQPASLADNDDVLRCERLPPDYAEVSHRIVPLPLGRLLRGQPDLML